MKKKARYIRGKEGDVYQGKGRGRISGVKKARYIRGKKGDVYQGKGRGRISGVNNNNNNLHLYSANLYMNIFGCALQYCYIKFMLKVTKA